MWILSILIYNLIIVFLTELTLGVLFGAKTVKKFITVALVNLITNPAVVLCMLSITLFAGNLRHIGIIILETGAVLSEGFLFSKFKTFAGENAYLISLVLNFSSYMAGEILDIFF